MYKKISYWEWFRKSCMLRICFFKLHTEKMFWKICMPGKVLCWKIIMKNCIQIKEYEQLYTVKSLGKIPCWKKWMFKLVIAMLVNWANNWYWKVFLPGSSCSGRSSTGTATSAPTKSPPRTPVWLRSPSVRRGASFRIGKKNLFQDFFSFKEIILFWHGVFYCIFFFYITLLKDCAQCASCSYIGSTNRSHYMRISERCGMSFRTGNLLKTRP